MAAPGAQGRDRILFEYRSGSRRLHPGNAGRSTGQEFCSSNRRLISPTRSVAQDRLPGTSHSLLAMESVWASSHGSFSALPGCRCVPGPAEGSSPCRAALLRGGSAPDALRHDLKSIGQAVRADVATAADRLRRFSLPYRRARYRSDGKKQPRDPPAGRRCVTSSSGNALRSLQAASLQAALQAARSPAQAPAPAGRGAARRHMTEARAKCLQHLGHVRASGSTPKLTTGVWSGSTVRS